MYFPSVISSGTQQWPTVNCDEMLVWIEPFWSYRRDYYKVGDNIDHV